jgi:hypothetical protein
VLVQDGSIYGVGGCDALRLCPDVATWETLGRLPVTGPCQAYTFTFAAYAGESGHVVFWSMPITGYDVYTAEYA